MTLKRLTKCTIVVLLTATLFTGCKEYAETVAEREGVTNFRHKSGGYMQYDIENGTVTCREHTTRSELTCWKNSN